MTYAVLKSQNPPITLAIPPMKSQTFYLLCRNIGPIRSLQTLKRTSKGVRQMISSEWFWYTYRSTACVNSWNKIRDPSGVRDYPSPAEVFFQWLQAYIGGWFRKPMVSPISQHTGWDNFWLSQIWLSRHQPFSIKKQVEVKSYLLDGLHFFLAI